MCVSQSLTTTLQPRCISVIVPIYNVANYLRQCLDSIIGQSYPHLDIILINDGSTDDSGRIADEYASADERIRVIHQENRGLSAVRNVGLSLAQGDYISFVDSDDWIEHHVYEDLIQIAKAHPAIDLIKFDYFSCEEHLDKRGRGELRFYDGVSALRAYQRGRLSETVWSGLYRADLAKSLSFVEGYCCEDVHYSLSLFCRSDIQIVFVNKRYYHYRASRPEAITSKGARLISDVLSLWHLLFAQVERGSHLWGLLTSCFVYKLYGSERIMIKELKRGLLSSDELAKRQKALTDAWTYAREHILPHVAEGDYDFRTWLYLKHPMLFWLSKRPTQYIKYRKYLVHN